MTTLSSIEEALLVVLDYADHNGGVSRETQQRIANLLGGLKVAGPWTTAGPYELRRHVALYDLHERRDKVTATHQYDSRRVHYTPEVLVSFGGPIWGRISHGPARFDSANPGASADVRRVGNMEAAQRWVDQKLVAAGYALCPGPLDPKPTE